VKYLYSWVMAMYDFNKVFLETAPMREMLEKAMRIVTEK
jgi:dynein heavy chain